MYILIIFSITFQFTDSIRKEEYLWLSFTANKSSLFNIKMDGSFFNKEVILGKVQILGIKEQVSKVFLNQNEIGFKYDFSTSVSFTIIII